MDTEEILISNGVILDAHLWNPHAKYLVVTLHVEEIQFAKPATHMEEVHLRVLVPLVIQEILLMAA